MEIFDTLHSIWPVLISIVGLIVWLIRLEGRVNTHEKDITRLDKAQEIQSVKHDELDSRLVEQLAQVRESLARIEGALGVKKEH